MPWVSFENVSHGNQSSGLFIHGHFSNACMMTLPKESKYSTKTMALSSLLILVLSYSAAAAAPPFACGPSFELTSSLPFCRSDLPIPDRARDVVSRLTLDEKISQLGNGAPAIPRLGIPAYEWWSEALHGVAQKGRGVTLNTTIKGATTFPQVILTAASFDEDIWYRIGEAIGTEARAVYNVGQAKGLAFWTPNINIFRDPRWGRGQETPGEDPTVTGRYAVAFVRGFQGDSPDGQQRLEGDRLKASACCKHFAAYDLDNWKNITRYAFNAKVTAQDMADTFQPPFQRCIQDARASGLMCSYNEVNGVPACASHDLLTVTARDQWNFNGYTVSDCDAVLTMFRDLKYGSQVDVVAASLNAGMDVNCGSYVQRFAKSAIDDQKLAESEIDRALHNLFSVRMRLGLFDGDVTKLPFGDIGPDRVCSKAHLDLALEAARSGIVLLKNDMNRLPLQKLKTSSLAVIGPSAESASLLLGNYGGPACKSITVLKAIQSYVSNTKYVAGCDTVTCSSASIDQAVQLAKSVEDVILVMGLNQTEEAEKHDRIDLVLPGNQQQLIRGVAEAAKKPIILVLLNGGPVDIRFARDDKNISAIIWAGYPGEAGGQALAEVIFGDHNPGGKLPITWYPQEFTSVPMTDMRMRPDPPTGYPGRTYRFYQGEKVFQFGYGIHYTDYSYRFISVTKRTFHLNSNVTRLVSELEADFCENQGRMSGKHPVLLFMRPEKPNGGRPVKQLVDFRSVSLEAGEKTKVEFELRLCEHLAISNEDGMMMLEGGRHFLVVGRAQYPITVKA
ncbi:hypothetical protein MLD38_022439 [Melastoma candidum]|uniref:Uncharacterized protein n=1 Tax=Melastoma candidum TaxID=119954 RepID=A0ACB9QSD6_9MYRT|nr:hypothetical protein MLD38_022439 [Melastoma candidum]